MSIKFFLHSETQKREVFQDNFLHENIPTPKRSQESDSTCKGTKILCVWNKVVVKQIALLGLDTFSSYMPSVRSLPEAMQKAKIKPVVRDKLKMHWKCVEKCIENALQHFSNRWKRFQTHCNHFWMRWQCTTLGWNLVEQAIANFRDCFHCHAIKNKSKTIIKESVTW